MVQVSLRAEPLQQIGTSDQVKVTDQNELYCDIIPCMVLTLVILSDGVAEVPATAQGNDLLRTDEQVILARGPSVLPILYTSFVLYMPSIFVNFYIIYVVH